jgi:hypothetical protein
VDLSDSTPNKFDPDARQILLRYFASNARWEVREEDGVRFAVRRESVDGRYETTLNGYYSQESNGWRQTRVSVSFEKPDWSGSDRGNSTKAMAGTHAVKLVIEGPHSGEREKNSSYLTVEGSSIFVGIFDQAPEIERLFTQRAYDEVCRELSDVLKHQREVREDGTMPVDSWYPISTPASPSFEARDGMQPGIYLLSAFTSPRSPGVVYVKAFNSNTGARLSKSFLEKESTRWVGWSESGSRLYPYNTEATVYEGDWSTKYEARFELWHRDEQGKETKLIEKSRLINGWQR